MRVLILILMLILTILRCIFPQAGIETLSSKASSSLALTLYMLTKDTDALQVAQAKEKMRPWIHYIDTICTIIELN